MENDKCKDPNCYACQHGLEEMFAWQEEMLKKHGWYAHYCPSDSGNKFLANCHTHGILENLLHPDFQVVVSIDPKICHGIFHRLVKLVREGHRFAEGVVAQEVIQNLPVGFVVAKENDRELLRVILPDKDGNLTRDKIQGVFALQFAEIENRNGE